jgi:hypothetical protein
VRPAGSLLDIARIQIDRALYWARETVAAREKNPKTRKKALDDARAHVAGLERLHDGLSEDAAYQEPFLWPVNTKDTWCRPPLALATSIPGGGRMMATSAGCCVHWFTHERRSARLRSSEFSGRASDYP